MSNHQPQTSKQKEVMKLIKESGILNPDATLEQIMNTSEKLSEFKAIRAEHHGLEAHEDTFIHEHFIHTHRD